MAKRVTIVGAKPKKIEMVDRPKRRIEPEELAAALGANPRGQQVAAHLDPIGLAELGAHLVQRLRSSGGRPALADSTVHCRVPLSVEDVEILQDMLSRIGESTGVKPSVGQLASAIVRLHLNALKTPPDPGASPDASRQDMTQQISKSILQQMIDEQINPLREQVKRLETELHAVCAGDE
jgi:hypothetical protein